MISTFTKTRFTAVLAVVATALTAAQALAAGTRVAIPGGTPITIRLAQKLDSGMANVGDTFAFTVDRDVVVNGWVVIPKGATGIGEVVSVDRAGGSGHPGSLGLKFDYVYAADGEKVLLGSAPTAEKGEASKGAASTATIVGYATLGLGGLFAHNFVKGHNLVLDSSRTFTTFVDHTVHVIATQRAEATDQIAH
jgi:hypothetical protein